MKLLLDTHVFLWWDSDSPQLNADVSAAIAQIENEVFVSAASIWEISIKRQSGKLRFSSSVTGAVARNGFELLAIEGMDAELAGGLKWDHKDPFDRMLIAQTHRHDMTLVSADRLVQGYKGVSLMRA